MDHNILEAAKNYINEVKLSPEYQEYEHQLENIQKEPELYARVNEFRRKNFELQNNESPETLMDRLDELEREYAGLRDTTLAENFLEAEVAFCRMMQEADSLIERELDFQ